MRIRSQLRRWCLVVAVFFTVATLTAEVVPSDSSPRQTPPLRSEVVRSDSTPAATVPAVRGEVVRSDSTPKAGTPPVRGEVVRSDSTPRNTTPAVRGEVVRSDSTPKQTLPSVRGEVVRSDSTPKSGAPTVKGEVVRSDSTPRSGAPAGVPPAAQPKAFVGEIAVGISLLITYGPQILALAATIATLAASVSVLVNTGKSSLEMVKGIGAKLNRLLHLLIGPLTVSSGMAKDGVNGLSDHLLSVAKFVTNSVSVPVTDLQGEVDGSIAMARNVEGISQRGALMARDLGALAADTRKDLGKVVAGGEVQLFRDGADRIAGYLEGQSGRLAGTFNGSIEHSRQAQNSLTGLQNRIGAAVAATGRPAGDLTLADLELSATEVSKSLLAARKEMLAANRELVNADIGASGVHSEIMSLLNGVKSDLEGFARQNGLSQAEIERVMKDPSLRSPKLAGVTSGGQAGKGGNADEVSQRLTRSISEYTDELSRLGMSVDLSLKGLQAKEMGAKFTGEKRSGKDSLEDLYLKKSQAYKAYIRVLTGEPDNTVAIADAKAKFEAAEAAYQAAAGQN